MKGHCIFSFRLLLNPAQVLSENPFFVSRRLLIFSLSVYYSDLWGFSESSSSPHFAFILSTPCATWTKYFPAVTLVTGPYRVEHCIVHERDGERKRGAGNARNNASPAVV